MNLRFFILLISLQFSSFAFGQDFRLYGLGHLSLDHVNDGQQRNFQTASNSSRIGVSGSFELNSDLTVIFQLESGVDLTGQGVNDGNGPADTEGQIFTRGRPSYVGLRGRFGTILAGHTDALDQWANHLNPFADSIGDLGNLWGGTGIPGRVDNAIQYSSPYLHGFNVVTTYVPREDGQESDRLFVKANYDIDDWNIAFAHSSIGVAPGLSKHQAQAMMFSYDFGKFRLGGSTQLESNVGGIRGSERKSYSLVATVRTGPNSLIRTQIATSQGDVQASDAVQFAIAYDYKLNADTTIYAAFASMQNDRQAQFSVNGKGHGDAITPALGDDPSAFSLGIVYRFELGLGDNMFLNNLLSSR